MKMETNSPEEDVINIQDLLNIFITKWYWFVVSVVITLSIAIVYIAITPSVYTRSVSVLLKDNAKNSSSLSTEEMFNDMGLFKSNTNIQNEILTIKAPILMEEVVNRLGLDVNYTIQERFKEKVLYKNSPVNIVFEGISVIKSLSLNLSLLPDNKVSISQLVVDGEDVGGENIIGNVSEIISTSVGNITVLPTSFYSTEFIGVPITFSKYSVHSAADQYFGALSVALADKNSSVVNISIKDVSTMRAEDILNTLILIYNENWVKSKNQITISTSQFINERLSVIERELGGVDNDISSFKSKNLLPDVASVSEKYLNQSGENEKKILGLTTQLAMARYISKYMNNDMAMNQLLPANSGVDNMKIETQIAEYNKLLLQRNNLLANSSEKNPVVVDMNQSLASMRGALIRSIDDLIVVLNIQIDNVTRSESKNLEKLASNPNQVKYLLSVERQQKVKEALYLFLLQKREENELSQAFTAYNTTVINPPHGTSFPISPKKNMILLIAFVIGVVIPAAFFFMLETMNTFVRNRKDLDGLTIPFIGVIPFVSGKNKKFSFRKKELPQVSIVIEEKSRNVINEAFRIVRTNIDFMSAKSGQGAVLLTTSIHMGSGKTFITINLAMSMAIKGAKVIVIDTDLRKASLSKVVNSPGEGLSDYLNERMDDVAKVKGALHPNLDIIPVGTIPPNPSELLLRERFELLITKLRSEYDYIFLDCSPIGLVADAAIIGKTCDLTLFVIRVGLMDRRVLPDVERIYTNNQLNKMCVILNGEDYNKGGKYGYYKYGYYRNK